MDCETFSMDAEVLGRQGLMGTSLQLSFAHLSGASMLGVLRIHQLHVTWASWQLSVLCASASLS